MHQDFISGGYRGQAFNGELTHQGIRPGIFILALKHFDLHCLLTMYCGLIGLTA